MNLSELRAKDRAKVELVHPLTGEPLLDDKGKQMFIICHTMDSRPYQDALRATRKAEGMDPVEGLSRVMGEVAIEWNMPFEDGKNISKEALVDLMANPEYAWLRDQVSNVINIRANFFDEPPSA